MDNRKNRILVSRAQCSSSSPGDANDDCPQSFRRRITCRFATYCLIQIGEPIWYKRPSFNSQVLYSLFPLQLCRLGLLGQKGDSLLRLPYLWLLLVPLVLLVLLRRRSLSNLIMSDNPGHLLRTKRLPGSVRNTSITTIKEKTPRTT